MKYQLRLYTDSVNVDQYEGIDIESYTNILQRSYNRIEENVLEYNLQIHLPGENVEDYKHLFDIAPMKISIVSIEETDSNENIVDEEEYFGYSLTRIQKASHMGQSGEKYLLIEFEKRQ